MEGMITESIECTDSTCHFCPSWETRAGRSVGLKVLLSSCPELRQGFHSEQRTWISAGLVIPPSSTAQISLTFLICKDTQGFQSSHPKDPYHKCSPPNIFSRKIITGLHFHPHCTKYKSQNRDGSCSKELCSLHSGCVRLLANTLLLLELVST